MHSYDGPHNNTSDSQRDFLIIYLVNGGMVLLVLLGLSILVILVLCFKLKQQKDHNNTEVSITKSTIYMYYILRYYVLYVYCYILRVLYTRCIYIYSSVLQTCCYNRYLYP